MPDLESSSIVGVDLFQVLLQLLPLIIGSLHLVLQSQQLLTVSFSVIPQLLNHLLQLLKLLTLSLQSIATQVMMTVITMMTVIMIMMNLAVPNT